MSHTMNVSQIVSHLLANGGITLKRTDAVNFTEYKGPGIVVGLDNNAQLCGTEKDLWLCVHEGCFNSNLSGFFGFWIEPTQAYYQGGPFPMECHTDRCVVLSDKSASDVAYACALAVLFDQQSVYHYGSGNTPQLQLANTWEPSADLAVWYDVLSIPATREKLIAIHADSHLAFPGTELPKLSVTLFRGYHGNLESIPLSDDDFTDWYIHSPASDYFKHRASDRQSQTRRVACRKLGV